MHPVLTGFFAFKIRQQGIHMYFLPIFDNKKSLHFK